MIWTRAPQSPGVAAGSVNVWRVRLDAPNLAEPFRTLLSPAEQERALGLRQPSDRNAFIIAHGALRTILAAYTQSRARNLVFAEGPFGKPSLVATGPDDRLEFNLAHSGEIMLLAVARGRAVGIDVVRRDITVDHAAVAERSFSLLERRTLASFADAPDLLIEAFYAAWCRKEAYLKATGTGLARGLDHFDVSSTPGRPAELLADRTDPYSTSRWTMIALTPSADYSAALVVESPVEVIALFDAPTPLTPASFQAPHASA